MTPYYFLINFEEPDHQEHLRPIFVFILSMVIFIYHFIVTLHILFCSIVLIVASFEVGWPMLSVQSFSKVFSNCLLILIDVVTCSLR